MEEMSRHGKVGRAAMLSAMDRKTARKYIEAGKLPSELEEPRTWRTRPDPFEAVWPALVARLSVAPTLEAKTLFEELVAEQPDQYQAGQLRTLQRRVREWRARSGPDKEVFFPQMHRAGEALQTDFTWGTELGVTVGGEPFVHMLCHVVLPYSNWEWATVCQSESMMALQRGVQAAVFRLGKVPRYHQTDNSTAATHKVTAGRREFNEKYVALMRHLGMEPRTTGIGEKEQNGDVESLNGVFKRRLEQQFLVRGSRDFDSVDAYERWVQGCVEKANHSRRDKVREELDAMRPVVVKRLPDHTWEEAIVTPWSTIRVLHNTYSVPSRLIGERVKVQVHEDRLEVFHGEVRQEVMPRLLGRQQHRIDYRHVIWSLVRKPGAFARYRYREDLFPTVTFRRAYDALATAHATERKADLEYVRVLHLAASTMESEVEAALQLVLGEGAVPHYERVKSLVEPRAPEVPALVAPEVDLHSYDALLRAVEGGG